jgi:signal transduction histidine kinase
MSPTATFSWTTSRTRVAMALLATALFAALLNAVADELGHAWWVANLTLGQAFLRLLQPWLLAAALALAMRELVVRRTLVVGPGWLTALLHAVAAAVFPVLHLWLLAVVHVLVFPEERARVMEDFTGMLPAYYVQGVVFYAAVAAAFYANEMARAAGERERQALELKASLSEARLAALRHQLSPHFLFNALNTVSMLIRQGRSDDALSMLAEFGGLMRDLLRESPDHEVSLAEELDFVRRYLEVERLRFSDRLAVSIDPAGGAASARVPSLILQPLVENAVRHGIARRAAAGRNAVTIRTTGATLELTVADDGPGLPGRLDQGPAGGVGLTNVRARLAQSYGELAGLSLASVPGGGVNATVHLPLRLAPAAGGSA